MAAVAIVEHVVPVHGDERDRGVRPAWNFEPTRDFVVWSKPLERLKSWFCLQLGGYVLRIPLPFNRP